ncbi:hypothetical protein [Streptomyces mirabilis]|uniref:hypothetical protein n=1 Tax=Streptomyces mirabilis TaxID=68239 RepID=UPI0033D70A09
MATTDLIGAQTRTSTAPLPPLAAKAMASLEARLASRTVSDQLAHEASTHVRITPDVHRAVVRYGICRDTLAELDGQRITTTAQFNALASAQDGLAEAVATLTAAGRLDLIEVAA